MLRALGAFLLLPGLMGFLFPWLVSMIPAPQWYTTPFSAVPFTAGCIILLISVISFYRRGKGTLAPWDPPKHLVVRDLYRFNRNPMYVGLIFIFLGWALITGNPYNYMYTVIVPFLFHLRVVLYEEKEMERLFTEEWEIYRKTVPRWGISLKPYTLPAEVESNQDSSEGHDNENTQST